MCICYRLMLWYAHEHNIKEMTKFQRIFFFSKKVFKCRSCNPATDMQTKSERKHSHNILVLVSQLCSSISSSLKENMVNRRNIKILIKFELRIQIQTNVHAYCFRRSIISSWMEETTSCKICSWRTIPCKYETNQCMVI